MTHLGTFGRYLWATQLSVRLGLINMQDEEIGSVRRAFVRKEVGYLSLNQIVWWDEIHRKCVIGMGSKVFVLIF